MIAIVVPAYREPGLSEFHDRLVEILDPEEEWVVIYSVGDLPTYYEVSEKRDLENVQVLVHYEPDRRLGVGIKTGLRIAMHVPNVRYVVTMEADGSNDPVDIDQLVYFANPISVAQKTVDFRSRRRKFPSAVYKYVLGKRYGLQEADYNHLFRCSTIEVVRAVFFDLRYGGYESVPEFLVRAKQKGFGHISQLHTVYYKRKSGKSKMTFRKMLSMLRLLIK